VRTFCVGDRSLLDRLIGRDLTIGECEMIYRDLTTSRVGEF